MTEASQAIVQMPLRVRYHECDPQGVVFNAHYLAYADMACFAWVNEAAGSHAALQEKGVDLMLAESTVRYFAPCRFDDELLVSAVTDRVGTTSLVLRFEMRRGDDVVTEVSNRYVWVDSTTYRPTAPPDALRAEFERLRSLAG